MLSVRPHLQYESLSPATTHVIAFVLGGDFFSRRFGSVHAVESTRRLSLFIVSFVVKRL